MQGSKLYSISVRDLQVYPYIFDSMLSFQSMDKFVNLLHQFLYSLFSLAFLYEIVLLITFDCNFIILSTWLYN